MAINNVFSYPIADYHCLVSGTPMPSGVANNEIINISASLNGKPANNLSIYSFNGDTTIKINVLEDVFFRQDHNNTFLTHAGFITSPMVANQIKKEKDSIVVPSGTSMIWSNELPINDVEVVAIVNGNKIIFS